MKLFETEGQLQAQCIELLMILENQNKLWFTRINTMPVAQRVGTRIVYRSMGKGAKTGISDLLIFFNKKTYWVELKSITGKQSEPQEVFQEAVEKFSGGEYLIVRNFETFKQFLKKIGAI
jgi:delta-aminolevulinic acid dehydratase/porphobilinogen synthase